MQSLSEFEEIIGYRFNNTKFLQNALTHTSYVNEHKSVAHTSNERMEFLGDSVLGLCVTEFLYANYKKLPEGMLSKIRASVVCEASLAKLASKLNLGKYILMGKGEMLSGGSEKPSVTSDAMESVIAAIYLDGGFESAKEKVLLWLKDDIVEAVEHNGRETDFKSALQEYCQSLGFAPEYRMIGESGPDHDKVFEAKVIIEDGRYAVGKGTNKKKSQQAAAKAMLDMLGIEV